jgi:broad-specificity NMP kinase
MDRDRIIIVSGLPRSGTSMMMKMLVAGGLEALTDDIRTADEDNPKGYFELEKVKELEKDRSWLGGAGGKVVKIISALLKHLPPDHSYKVIFMRRNMQEVLASQRQMLIRRGEPTDKISDEKMAELFRKHLVDVEAWLARQPNVETLYVDYNAMLAGPAPLIESVRSFLGEHLDAGAMATTIDSGLYRQRR